MPLTAVVAVSIVAILVLAGALGFALRLLDRKEAAWAQERNLLISATAGQLQDANADAAAERRHLLDRIQAPEYAPAMAAQATPPPPPDKTYSEEQELHNLIHGLGEEGSDGVA